MKIKNKIVILLVSFLSVTLHAQKLELGKVTIAELEEKSYPTEPDAPAAILFEKGKVSFEYSQADGFIMITRVQAKIKIYKKEGFDWANKKVRYFNFSTSRENIRFDDVATYNLVDGKIEKTKLKSDGEFDEKINKYWSQKKISMPNVKEGSIVEFEYTVKSPRFFEMKEWSFQSSIPVKYSEFITNIPEYYVYKSNQKGFVFPKTTMEKKYGSLTLNGKERSEGRVTTSTFNTQKIDFEETQTTYIAQNLPSMKEEAYVNNIENYTSSISHELTMTRFYNQPFKTFSTNWETVTKKIYENDDFGNELDKSGYFENDINILLAGVNSPIERIGKIFSFVKSKVKWNNYSGYSCNDGVKNAYKNNVGNVAEINLMLTAMLRFAGLNSNPVLLSTRSNGIAMFPTLTAFNYVISAVETDNGIILLDATDSYSVPNTLPLRDLNWFGRIIRKNGTSDEISLTPTQQSSEINNLQVLMTNDGNISGKVRKQYTTHKALSFRQKNVGQNQDNYLEEIENKYGLNEISEYERKNDLDLNNPVIETFSFKDTNAFEIINDKIYISPLFFLSETENPFKQEKREYPVDFGFPLQEVYNVNIEIPSDYAIEKLPEMSNLTTEENLGSFKYLISATDNKIQLKITSTINEAIVPADMYETLKIFFQKMIDKQNEKIVLKKI